jgi:hypothetical protein
MVDVIKKLADLSVAQGQVITLTQEFARSDDPQVKWVIGSNLRTTLEISATKARVDCLLEMRKPANPPPTEPPTKK